MKATVNLKGYDTIKKKIEKMEQEQREGVEKKVGKAAIILKREIQRVIRDYNRGLLKRDKSTGELGVAEKPPTREELLKRAKGDLIDTGYYVSNWSIDVEKQLSEVIGRVYTNTHYAIWLEEGNSQMQAFRVVELAFVRAYPDMLKALGVE